MVNDGKIDIEVNASVGDAVISAIKIEQVIIYDGSASIDSIENDNTTLDPEISQADDTEVDDVNIGQQDDSDESNQKIIVGNLSLTSGNNLPATFQFSAMGSADQKLVISNEGNIVYEGYFPVVCMETPIGEEICQELTTLSDSIMITGINQTEISFTIIDIDENETQAIESYNIEGTNCIDNEVIYTQNIAPAFQACGGCHNGIATEFNTFDYNDFANYAAGAGDGFADYAGSGTNHAGGQQWVTGGSVYRNMKAITWRAANDFQCP